MWYVFLQRVKCISFYNYLGKKSVESKPASAKLGPQSSFIYLGRRMCRCVDLICLLCACAQRCTCTLTKPAYWIYRLDPDWKPEDNRTLPASLPRRSVSCCFTRDNGAYLLTSRCSHGNTSKELEDWQKRERQREEKQAWDTLLLYCCTLDFLSVTALSHVSFPSCRKWTPKRSTARIGAVAIHCTQRKSLHLNIFVRLRACLYIFQGFVGIHCPT